MYFFFLSVQSVGLLVGLGDEITVHMRKNLLSLKHKAINIYLAERNIDTHRETDRSTNTTVKLTTIEITSPHPPDHPSRLISFSNRHLLAGVPHQTTCVDLVGLDPRGHQNLWATTPVALTGPTAGHLTIVADYGEAEGREVDITSGIANKDSGCYEEENKTCFWNELLKWKNMLWVTNFTESQKR